MIEQPRNRNPNTTKTMKLNGPASVPAPTSVVMGPDRERVRQQDRRMISKNTSSTISTSSEQVDPMNDKSAMRLNGLNTVANPNVKLHDTKKKLSHSVDSTSLNCRDSQSATLCPTQVSKWGAGGRGCGSGRGHECTPVVQYEIAFENIFSVKIQDFKTDNEKSKHSLSTMIPGQLEAFCLKEFCNSIPKYILALKTDEQRMKIEKISNSFRLKTDKGKPSQISTYMAYHWSYDDKISSFEAYAVTYDKISTYEAYMDAYDDNAASCA
tara:strand:+ start:189 stop:992 length:804 start_codon:yes stop_codon:yes gene_type:complete